MRRDALLPWTFVVLLVTLPATAHAQRDEFANALTRFHALLSGEFGDEGPLVRQSLDAMEAALSQWDAELTVAAREMAAVLAAASPPTAVQARLVLGSLHLNRGQLERASREFEAAARLDPDHAELHVFRGLAFDAAARYGEADAAYLEAWRATPANPFRAYLLLVRSPAGAGHAEVQRATEALLEAQRRLLAGATPQPANPPFVDVSLVPDLAADRPVFAPARYAEGFALVAAGRYREAVAHFRTAAGGDPLLVDAALASGPLQQAVAELRQGRIAASLPHFEAATALQPSSSEAHRLLGIARWLHGATDAAVESLRTAVALRPDDERARVALGRFLHALGESDEADAVLRDTLERLPRSAEARFVRAAIQEARRDGPAALEQLKAAAQETVLAGKRELYLRIAQLAHEQIDPEGAIAALTERVRLHPNAPGAHRDLGAALAAQGRQPEALAELVVALLLAPDDIETLRVLGTLHLRAGRVEDAVGVLRHAVSIEPRFAHARYALGRALIRAGHLAEGKRELAAYAALHTDEEERQRARLDAARLQVEAAAAAREGRREAALDRRQRIVEVEPGVAANHVALADAYIAAGRLSDAVRALGRALELSPDPLTYRRLAEVYASMSEPELSAGARAEYERRRHQAGVAAPQE